MELLYDDDMKIKVKGTAMIMDLARDAGNLEADTERVTNGRPVPSFERGLQEEHGFNN